MRKDFQKGNAIQINILRSNCLIVSELRGMLILSFLR